MLNDHQEVNAFQRRLLLFEEAVKGATNPDIGDPRGNKKRDPAEKTIERRIMQDVESRSWS
jgi:hypothetical protein